MREVVYRGKRLDNGKWVYGYLIQNSPFNVEIANRGKNTLELVLHKVDSETVGQYVGKNHKNRKIFEGDIFLEKTFDRIYMFVVRYGEYPEQFCEGKTNLGFYCDWISNGGLPIKAGSPFNGLLRWIGNYNLVGNIHDNPELILSCQ